jgi:hypothetical protein
MRKKVIPWLVMLLAVLVLGFSGCGGGGSSATPSSPSGTVEGKAK